MLACDKCPKSEILKKMINHKLTNKQEISDKICFDAPVFNIFPSQNNLNKINVMDGETFVLIGKRKYIFFNRRESDEFLRNLIFKNY